MSPQAITGIATVLISALASVVLPVIVIRRDNKEKERKATELAEEKKQEKENKDAAAETVSWTMINKAVVKERDDLLRRQEQAEARHTRQMENMQERHARALNEMKANYDAQLAAAGQRLKFLEQEVERLNRQLYGPRGA